MKGSTAARAPQGKPARPPRPAQADAAPRQPPPREATVIIVGSGPAGLGTAALFEQCGIDVVVLERGEIAQTFRSWYVVCSTNKRLSHHTPHRGSSVSHAVLFPKTWRFSSAHGEKGGVGCAHPNNMCLTVRQSHPSSA